MDLNLKSDLLHRQLKEGNPTLKTPSAKDALYSTPFPEKKLVIIWDTGKMMSFYYSYLIGTDHDFDNDVNTLTLMFMKHDLVLTGYNLELLFFQFVKDEPHILKVNTKRYITEIPDNQFVLTDAIVEK